MASVTSGLFGPVASGANTSAAISGGSSASASAIAMLNQMQTSGQYNSPERAWEAWQAMQNQTNVAKPWVNPYGNLPDETGMDHPMTVVGGNYGTFHGEAPGGFDMPSLVGQGGASGGGGGGGGGSSGGGAGGGTDKPTDPLATPPGTNTPGTGFPTGGGLLGGGAAPGGINTGNTYFPTGVPPSVQPGGPGGTIPGGQPPGSQPGGSTGAQNYLNTPMNQLLGDPSYGRFEHSPGYQYAVDEALGQVQRNASSRGLLESGAVMRDMTDRAQGMAQQDYGNWWNRQNQLYNSYQDRLAGLAGGPTGADQAFNLGQAQGASSNQMGSNLGSLFGNQGMGGFGGMVNTGAAQGNNTMQAGNTQAQIQSANQATQLANSMLNRPTQTQMAPAQNTQRRF